MVATVPRSTRLLPPGRPHLTQITSTARRACRRYGRTSQLKLGTLADAAKRTPRRLRDRGVVWAGYRNSIVLHRRALLGIAYGQGEDQ
jgi:hypothetical protein